MFCAKWTKTAAFVRLLVIIDIHIFVKIFATVLCYSAPTKPYVVYF